MLCLSNSHTVHQVEALVRVLFRNACILPLHVSAALRAPACFATAECGYGAWGESRALNALGLQYAQRPTLNKSMLGVRYPWHVK